MITRLIDNTAPVGNVASAISLLRGSLFPGTAQHGHVGTRQLPNSMTILSLGTARLPASGVSVEGVTAPSSAEGAASLTPIYAQALPMPFIEASYTLTARQSVWQLRQWTLILSTTRPRPLGCFATYAGVLIFCTPAAPLTATDRVASALSLSLIQILGCLMR